MAKLTTPTRLKLAYAGLAATDSWLSGIPAVVPISPGT